MNATTDKRAGHRLLIRWVRLVGRWALPVLVVALLATLGAAYVTVTRIGINTDTTDMLSEELAFRRHNRALSQAFPQFTDNLTVIVEAATPDLAEDAAARLAAEIGARPRLFRDVFYAQGDAFFRRNGLLYLELDELEALGDRLAEVQPLLAALGQDPSLRGLSGVLRLALGDADAGPDGRSAEEAAAAVAPALEKLAAAAESLAARAPGGRPAQAMSWHALLSGEDPEPADKRRFIVLRPMLDFTSLEPAAQAIEALRRLAAELGLTEDNGLRVRLTGEAVMFQEELGSVRDGMGLAGLLSACLVFALLVLGLRSARLVGATLVTLVMGLIWTAAFATLAIGELNLISVAFAVLFIGLSVDFGIHFTLRYREAVEAQAGPGANSGEAKSDEANSGEANSGDADPGDAQPGDALAEAARSVGGALTLCAVAAAIGFFAFLPTAYRGVSELGLISGVGMFIALFANLTVLPAILSLMPLAPGGRVLHSPLGDPVQRLVARHPRRVIGGALALGIGAAALLPFVWFDDDPLNLRDPASESVATLLDLFDDPRVAPYSAKVLARDLAAGEALAARLEALPEVDSARVLSDFLPAEQDDKLAIIEEMAVFLAPVFDAAGPGPAPGPAHGPEGNRRALRDLRASPETASLEIAGGALAGGARRLAAALDSLASHSLASEGGGVSEATLGELERVWLGALPGRLDALGAALEADTVTLDDLPEGLRARHLSADGRARVEIVPQDDLRDAAARRRFVDAIRTVAPEAAGAPVTITEAGRAVVRAFGEAAAYALVLIVVLLVVRLRSLRDSMMVLAPLMLAALLTVGATVAFGVPFNFANVVVLPLLFGLGVASGIHMVVRARHAGAAGLMATSTPRAVLFSALTTIGSFCALALSSHRGTSSMGVLLTIAITLTMACTLVVLPALLTRPPRPAAILRRPGSRRPGLRPPGLGRLLPWRRR